MSGDELLGPDAGTFVAELFGTAEPASADAPAEPPPALTAAREGGNPRAHRRDNTADFAAELFSGQGLYDNYVHVPNERGEPPLTVY